MPGAADAPDNAAAPTSGLASHGKAFWPCLSAFLLTLAVYRLTLLPGVGTWDVAEFQAVPRLLGVLHPTGFPTYTLLGWLFSWWPEGSVAFRMNLLSALCAAGAVAAVVAVAGQLGAGAAAALAAGFAVAFSAPFWESAVAAQPHTLHLLMAVTLLGLAIAWRRDDDTRRFAALGLLTGLGLGNHLQFVMLLPALVLLAATLRPPSLRRARTWAVGLGAGLVGLSVYAYLPLAAMRNPPINYAHPTSWERFRYLVLGEQFHNDMAFLSLNGLINGPFRFGRLLPQVAEWLTPPGALLLGALALVGLVTLLRRDWRVAAFLTLAWLVPLYNGLNYVDQDLRRYFFVSLAITAIAAAVGLQALADRLGGRLAIAATTAVALAASTLAPIHWAAADRHADHGGAHLIERVFATTKPQAVVISWWSVSTALWYGRYIEQRRPDLMVVDDRNLVDDGWGTVEAVVDAHLGKRPVYLIRFPHAIRAMQERYELRPVTSVPPFEQIMYEVVARARR